METVRSALYLDFDNVFSGLVRLDPGSAIRFAEDPATWVSRLRTELADEGTRRWLVLRCYMNPSGWVPNPQGEDARLYFSRYRPQFTDAGFEVVDCPRLTHTKNGADIRLVLDAAEALRADVRYDEFVIASGDSDMTPLLVRLRAADRRVTVFSPSDSAEVLGAIADRLVGGEELLELLQEEAVEPPVDKIDEERSHRAAGGAGLEGAAVVAEPDIDLDVAKARFDDIVRDRYRTAAKPLVLATLAHQLRDELGPVTTTSRWFGQGFMGALQGLDLAGVRMSQRYLWDTTRHEAPVDMTWTDKDLAPPDAVSRVTAGLRLPRLPQDAWLPIYEMLATFVGAYDFNLTDATRWARDRLGERGVEVSRKAVTVVAQGASYGGRPLYSKPAPTAQEIGEAFVSNVLNRAAAADIELTDLEAEAVRAWFGRHGGTGV